MWACRIPAIVRCSHCARRCSAGLAGHRKTKPGRANKIRKGCKGYLVMLYAVNNKACLFIKTGFVLYRGLVGVIL